MSIWDRIRDRRHKALLEQLRQTSTRLGAVKALEQQARRDLATARAVYDAAKDAHLSTVADWDSRCAELQRANERLTEDLRKANGANGHLRARNDWQAGKIRELEQERAELEATVAGLGEQLRDQEKRLEDKQFMDEDHAYGRRMDGEADHL